MEFSSRKRLEPNLNMTPLIDAVLLLLIFFMLSSTFVVQPGIKVDLPEATTEPLPKSREATVLIQPDGQLYFEAEPVALAELRRRLESNQSSLDRYETLVVQADRNVPHGFVVNVMELARAVGLDIAVGTTPRTTNADSEVAE